MNKAFLCLFCFCIMNSHAMVISTIEIPEVALENIYFISRSTSESEFKSSPKEAQLFIKLNAILAPNIYFNSYKSNLSRALKLIETEQDHCSYNVLKSAEREKKMIFSAFPSTIFPQRQALFIDPKLNNVLADTVSITELISQYKVGLVPSYYGESIKESDKKNSNLTFISGIENHSQLAHMLAKKRFDFIIDYQATATRALNGLNITLYARNLREVETYQAGFFACNRSELGRRVITKINTAFLTESFKKLIQSLHLDAFSNEQAEDVLSIYKRDFNLNMTPTNAIKIQH